MGLMDAGACIAFEKVSSRSCILLFLSVRMVIPECKKKPSQRASRLLSLLFENKCFWTSFSVMVSNYEPSK